MKKEHLSLRIISFLKTKITLKKSNIGFKIEKNMTDDFNKDTGRIIPSTFYEGKPIDKYTSEEVNYFKERDKYVNEHKNRYINLYEKELSVYGFEVKFVN